MAAKTLPTRERASDLIDYDPQTGAFTWRPGSLYAGKSAGCMADGKVYIGIDYGIYRAHRIAWLLVYGEPVPAGIDHIDGNPHNNKLDNLRAANQTQNNANSAKPKNNSSGVKGVSFKKDKGKFKAYLMLNNKQIHLGYFSTVEQAAEARREAAERIYGEFARHD